MEDYTQLPIEKGNANFAVACSLASKSILSDLTCTVLKPDTETVFVGTTMLVRRRRRTGRSLQRNEEESAGHVISVIRRRYNVTRGCPATGVR